MYESIKQLGQMINDFALRVGNYVKNSTNSDKVSGGYQLGADSNGKLVAADATTGTKIHAQQSATDGALPAIKIEQADISEELMYIKSIPSEGDVYQTLVTGASTSLTTRGFFRIYVKADDAVMSTGYYYIPFGNIT